MSSLITSSSQIVPLKISKKWAEALQSIYGSDVTIHVKEPSEEDLSNGNEVDAAAIISENTLLAANDLFPDRMLVLPWSARKSQGRYFLVEFHNAHVDVDTKILRFVSYYYDLLRTDGKSMISPPTLAETVRSICEKPTRIETKLLFVFNGMDPRHVERRILASITKVTGEESMTICGCEVICVWCPSTDLMNWKWTLSYVQEIEILRQSTKQRLQDKLHKQFDEVRQLLNEKLRQSDDDIQQEEHGKQRDEVLRQKEKVIAELREELQSLEQDIAPVRTKRKLEE